MEHQRRRAAAVMCSRSGGRPAWCRAKATGQRWAAALVMPPLRQRSFVDGTGRKSTGWAVPAQQRQPCAQPGKVRRRRCASVWHLTGPRHGAGRCLPRGAATRCHPAWVLDGAGGGCAARVHGAAAAAGDGCVAVTTALGELRSQCLPASAARAACRSCVAGRGQTARLMKRRRRSAEAGGSSSDCRWQGLQTPHPWRNRPQQQQPGSQRQAAARTAARVSQLR